MTTPAMPLESVLVVCKKNLTVDDKLRLEQNFMQWGAREVVRFWPRISTYHLRLEAMETWSTFARRASSEIESVDPVQGLEYSSMSDSNKVYVSSKLQLDAWWHRLLRIEMAHRLTRGRGALVALVDSGVSYHPELFDRDFEQMRISCCSPSSPIYRDEVFRQECYSIWEAKEAEGVKHRVNLERISKAYRAWDGHRGSIIIQHVQQLIGDNSQFSPAELNRMSPRLKSAKSLSDVSLKDLEEFGRAVNLVDQADAIVAEIIRETFEQDWDVEGRHLCSRFDNEPILLFDVLARSWRLPTGKRGQSPVKRVMHPSSGASNGGLFADYVGHGTNLAGVLFSSVTGVCPEAGCLALPVRGDSQPDTAGLIDALYNAGDAGACVALVGFSLPPDAAVGGAVRIAFKDAFDQGVLVIVPAGNHAKGNTGLISIPDTVSVGSITPGGMPTCNHRGVAEIDVWAYGGGGEHGFSMNRARNEYADYRDQTRIMCTRIGGGFDFCQGTSIAAAQVAGVAALIYSLSGRSVRDPAWLRARLLQCRQTDAVSPIAPPALRSTGVVDASRIDAAAFPP